MAVRGVSPNSLRRAFGDARSSVAVSTERNRLPVALAQELRAFPGRRVVSPGHADENVTPEADRITVALSFPAGPRRAAGPGAHVINALASL